jgi:hypothetical protein
VCARYASPLPADRAGIGLPHRQTIRASEICFASIGRIKSQFKL